MYGAKTPDSVLFIDFSPIPGVLFNSCRSWVSSFSGNEELRGSPCRESVKSAEKAASSEIRSAIRIARLAAVGCQTSARSRSAKKTAPSAPRQSAPAVCVPTRSQKRCKFSSTAKKRPLASFFYVSAGSRLPAHINTRYGSEPFQKKPLPHGNGLLSACT